MDQNMKGKRQGKLKDFARGLLPCCERAQPRIEQIDSQCQAKGRL